MFALLNLSNMPELIDQLKEMSQDELKARLETIVPTIDFLTKVWRSELKGASFTMAARIDDVLESHGVHWYYENVPELFKEFIHNYCTLLCAEKLLLEALLTKLK